MSGKLRPKYVVTKIVAVEATLPGTMKATDPDNINSPFVLMPHKDPAAYYAMLSYAQVCEDELAREIRVWLKKVVSAPPAYGTQGERNRVNMKLKQMDLFV